MLKSDLYIGLISGTSVDGVDCVLVSFADDKPVLIASYFEESIEADSEDDLFDDENEESIEADSDEESNYTITISEWYSSYGV